MTRTVTPTRDAPATHDTGDLSLDLRAAESGDAEAMLRLALHYGQDSIGKPGLDGHKALSFFVAAYRRDPEAAAPLVPRVLTDMEALFDTPASSPTTPPWESPPPEAVSEAAARTIALFPELILVSLVPRLLRGVAFESATGRGEGFAVAPLSRGDWHEAVRLANEDPVLHRLTAHC